MEWMSEWVEEWMSEMNTNLFTPRLIHSSTHPHNVLELSRIAGVAW